MRTRVAILLVAALALGACTSSEGTDPDPAATESSTSTASESAGGRTDLPSGVVATVGGEDITIEVLEARLDVIREIPDVKTQLEADGGDALEPRLKARALGELVLQKVVLQAAADQGVEVTDAELEAKRAELVEAAGGEDAFAEQLAGAGVPEDQFPGDLSASIAFEKVIDQLAAEQGIDPNAAATPTEASTTEPASEEATTEPASTEPASTSTDAASPTESETTSVAQQIADIKREWLTRILTDADVQVDYVFGTWDPTTGQVQPPR